MLVLYTLVALPYRICFVIEDSAELKAVDYAIDAFFVLDIILNFNTTYDATPDDDSDNILELDRWLVAKNYLKVKSNLSVNSKFAIYSDNDITILNDIYIYFPLVVVVFSRFSSDYTLGSRHFLVSK